MGTEVGTEVGVGTEAGTGVGTGAGTGIGTGGITAAATAVFGGGEFLLASTPAIILVTTGTVITRAAATSFK
jgi:hypothetical protein